MIDSAACKLTYCASRLDKLELGKISEDIEYETYDDMVYILWESDEEGEEEKIPIISTKIPLTHNSIKSEFDDLGFLDEKHLMCFYWLVNKNRKTYADETITADDLDTEAEENKVVPEDDLTYDIEFTDDWIHDK